MITLFSGPAPLAELVREELLRRGVAAEAHSLNPVSQFFGSALGGSAGWRAVIVTEDAAERHRAVIEEVLALVTALEPPEVTPAPPPPGRGDEVSPADAGRHLIRRRPKPPAERER